MLTTAEAAAVGEEVQRLYAVQAATRMGLSEETGLAALERAGMDKGSYRLNSDPPAENVLGVLLADPSFTTLLTTLARSDLLLMPP